MDVFGLDDTRRAFGEQFTLILGVPIEFHGEDLHVGEVDSLEGLTAAEGLQSTAFLEALCSFVTACPFASLYDWSPSQILSDDVLHGFDDHKFYSDHTRNLKKLAYCRALIEMAGSWRDPRRHRDAKFLTPLTSR